jgi:tartrate-resistant acid phosphatase type 5
MSCEFSFRKVPLMNRDNVKKTELIEFKKNYSFIVIGDFGEKGKYFQKEVANVMELYSKEVDFVFTVGDNFYPSGLSGLEDSHLQKSYLTIYSKLSLKPWYITLGNHDYRGDLQTYYDYSLINPNWNFPFYYYAVHKFFKKDSFAQFLVSDTNQFYRILNFIPYRRNASEESMKQLSWMKDRFSKNSSKWNFVFGHHPIFSSGRHGDTEVLKGDFLKTLAEGKVDIYFSGHEHNLQYLKNPNFDTHFIVSGAGSKVRKGGESSFTIFKKEIPGFVFVNLEESSCKVQFISFKNELLYSFEIKK